MRRVLVTGISDAGKSTALAERARRWGTLRFGVGVHQLAAMRVCERLRDRKAGNHCPRSFVLHLGRSARRGAGELLAAARAAILDREAEIKARRRT